MVDRIGHYRVVAELGRGGMGIVYKAHEESLNRFVAIKVLGEHLTEDPGHVERFLREARSAAALNHPNIVQIYTVSEDQGRHFFAMEYVSGRSLQQILKSSGPLEPIQVAHPPRPELAERRQQLLLAVVVRRQRLADRGDPHRPSADGAAPLRAKLVKAASV